MSKKMLRAAFASDDRQTVNAEFINAKHLVIYEVDTNGCTHTTTYDFPDGTGGGMNNPRLAALQGCGLIFVAKPVIGEEALALIRSHVFVSKIEGNQRIADLLDKLLFTLRDNPPPWMRKTWERETRGGAMSFA
ncbi:hypothetical protein JWJ90_07400 [Desulfobulbus rhabdoformis]|uniref:NifB/NifX family molybdenum-iron cluster-binding protein n=1 Tax=Desulfobulbus rhabdoformis TaxID=34032 RepID=UPI0019658962|nr:NifB/NifX family molybdenum-iron cluster-binding protein [Desulfobulbus rhabdoformis]MBM9614111.1 hypothetical protein [Desulfobulbus rhabdoformis]